MKDRKKSDPKKLKLSKLTLRQLAPSELAQVNGGALVKTRYCVPDFM